jgi:NADH-quinone oxidoreductase subunit J
MEFKTFLFYAFSAIMVLAATRVITARNPVHAALFLVLAFFNAAGIWLLLKAEFLAIVLVLVYVGAVMVLFLFVVMMLDINIDRMREGFWGYLPLASGIGALIVLEMAAVLWRGFDSNVQEPAKAASIGGTKELGILIYTKYIYGFEIAAVILLVAIIAARPSTRATPCASSATTACASSRWRRSTSLRSMRPRLPQPLPPLNRRSRHDLVARTLPDPGGDPVRHLDRGNFPEPQKHHRAADGDRIDAAGGQPELCRVLPLPGRCVRADLCLLHPHRCRRRVGHRSGDSGRAVP